MRYEFGLVVRIALALAILSPLYYSNFNIYQFVFERMLLKSTFYLLGLIGFAPVIGKYSVKNAIEIFGVASLKIVKYCVTASAYYSWTLLILLTKDITFLKSLLLYAIGVVLIYAMNQIRIIVLVFALLKNPDAFAQLHFVLWFVLSIGYVAAMWLVFSWVFKVKSIPVYSDMKYLVESMR